MAAQVPFTLCCCTGCSFQCGHRLYSLATQFQLNTGLRKMSLYLHAHIMPYNYQVICNLTTVIKYYKLVNGIQKLLCFSQTETHKKQKSLFQFTNSHFLFQCCHYLNQQQWLKGIAVININHKGLSLLTISHHFFPSGSLNMLSFFLLAGKMENEWQKH